jgi:hypothetical protein
MEAENSTETLTSAHHTTLLDGLEQLNTTRNFRSFNMEFIFDWKERSVQ